MKPKLKPEDGRIGVVKMKMILSKGQYVKSQEGRI